MSISLSRSNLMQLKELSDRATSFWLSLWDPESSGFRFASHQPATLMATSYCVLGLEFVGGLSQLSKSQRESIISFLMAGIQPDGSFKDFLFREEDILSQEHDLAYFQEETTTICQQALDALGAPLPPPRIWSKGQNTAEGLIQFFETLPWQNPWLDSNPVMFVLSQLCHDVERHHKKEYIEAIDAGLDWLDAHQSPTTGLWQGPYEVSLLNAMAATFHFTFFYGYRSRSIQYVERIIDSCLMLQESHGLFGGSAIGQTCLDYDALDLLAKAALATDYRSNEVETALMRAYATLLALHNPDGGFANCKERLTDPTKGRKAKLLKKLRLSMLIPAPRRIPAQELYHVCWRPLSCPTPESNAFSTWFRLLSLYLASQSQWLNTDSKPFTFRRLPFLGYHNWSTAKFPEGSQSWSL